MITYKGAKRRWIVVYDMGHTVDSFDCDTFEEAKNAALYTLITWMIDQSYNYPPDYEEWNEKEISDWNYMINEYSVSVKDRTKNNNEDFEEVWSPSDEEKKKICWLTYDELIEEGRKDGNSVL